MSNDSPDQPRTGAVDAIGKLIEKVDAMVGWDWSICTADEVREANSELAALRSRLEEAEAREKKLVAFRDAFGYWMTLIEYDRDDESDRHGVTVRDLYDATLPTMEDVAGILSTPSKEQDHE